MGDGKRAAMHTLDFGLLGQHTEVAPRRGFANGEVLADRPHRSPAHLLNEA
jgi:hypothetical protein